ncbi:MAG: hypothetical protein FWE03_04770 [Firmicutes bacterium]|nr:hypothetical protein [Bacillota bacterium]
MMKKYFSYEFKKSLIPVLVLLVMATVITVIFTATANFAPRSWFNDWTGEMIYTIPPSRLSVPIILFAIMCFVVPMVVFSFKMNSRQIDSLYSMSIKRCKIYLVKAIIGLIAVFIAYTVSFWSMVIITAAMPNGFVFSGFVVAYFLSLPIGFGIFGFNAFVFSRANRVLDGVIFVIIYSTVLALLMVSINNIVATRVGGTIFGRWGDTSPLAPNRWFVYSPIALLISRQENIVVGSNFFSPENLWVMYLFWGLVGAASWVGLILLLPREKSENAEMISNSKFGYIVLLPLTIISAFLVSGLDSIPFRLILFSIIIVAGGLLYVVYKRSFKLKLADIIVFTGAVALGIGLSFLVSYLSNWGGLLF